MVALTLKYPTDEPGAAAACQDIADQIGRLAASVGWKVQIKPVGLPPRQLRKDLAERQYELAYHHHDYATEGYWLWPLFDSREEALKPGGTNFLGYKDDADLEDLFRNMMRQRDFAEVKKLAHNIQGHLFERMPFIPLWQLDTHIAVHSALRPAHVDPLLVFDAVADWKLLTAAALGGLRATALELGVSYVKARQAFGVIIGSFQAVQHRLADLVVAGDGAQLLTYEAAWARDTAQPGTGQPDAAALASMAFLFNADCAFRTARECLQFHGGYGVTLEYDIQLYFRRAKAWPLALGDPRREYQRLADLAYPEE